MQGRAFETCIWSGTFGLCVLMFLADTASATTGGVAMEIATNPLVYILGLLGTFIGCKLFSSSGAQF